MLSRRHKDVLDQAMRTFSARGAIVSLWQDIAENFYPERADFTTSRSMGEDFAAHLDTSYPILARRDLSNSFGAMLRPSEKDWFHIRVKNREVDDDDGREWLEMTERVQRRAMYDRNSGFVRATKEADADYAAFGQAVISSELHTEPSIGQILLHRSWHLRDVAWTENSIGRIGTIYRRWKPDARELVDTFGGKVDSAVTEAITRNEAHTKFNVMHIMVPAHQFEGSFRTPYISIYIDVDNEHLMEEVGSWTQMYTIPRWQTVSGIQYAYSPATVAALPDARLIQAMTYTLLTAGEKAVDPPMIGVGEAIRGGIESFAGGFTAVDAQYDERLGEVLRPLHTDGAKSIPLGLEMTQDTRMMISEAFYLNRLTLPPPQSDMTAYEVAQRIEQYIRDALPLFEPMESDYNGSLCETDFDILLRNGAFGPLENKPESLRGQEIEFHFESPLREAADRIDGQRFLEAKALTVEASPTYPQAVRMIDTGRALRDALKGIGTPADWMLSEGEMAELDEQAEAAQAAQGLLENVSAGAQVAEQVGNAGQAMGAAQEGAAPTGAPPQLVEAA